MGRAVLLVSFRLIGVFGCGALVLAPGAAAHADEPRPIPPSTATGPLFRAAPDVSAAPAPAGPPRVVVRLDYSRGPGATDVCPDEQGFRDAVAAHVGYDPFTSPAPRVATVTIERQGGAFVALMELRNAAGAREWAHAPLSGADCRKLVRTMGLAIAIPIDPFPAHPPVLVDPAQPPPTPPSPVPASPDRLAPPTPARPPERPKIRVGVRGGVELGTAPGATAGFGVQLGVRWPTVSLSIEGHADLPASGSGNVGPMSRVRAGLMAGSLVPCGHIPLPGHWNIPVCGLLTLGAIRGEGLSVDVPNSGTGFYAASGARAGLEIPVNDSGSIALRVDGEALGTIKPVTIMLNGHDAWTTGRVSGGVGGGMRVDF